VALSAARRVGFIHHRRKRQRILFGHPRRLLRQHHQRRLPGGRLFVVRCCRVHGYRYVHGVLGLQHVLGGERVLVDIDRPGYRDSLGQMDR
jgi:hypothetical protein